VRAVECCKGNFSRVDKLEGCTFQLRRYQVAELQADGDRAIALDANEYSGKARYREKLLENTGRRPLYGNAIKLCKFGVN